MKKKMKIEDLKVKSFTTSLSGDESKTAKGGTDLVICGVPIIVSAGLSYAFGCTKGEGCDIPTIGHDDGSWCISKDPDAWCGGR